MSSPARFLTSYADPALIPAGGLPHVAFLGRSNAGKSSLINTLTGIKKLAYVSATPGRTRLINVFEVDGFWLVDLPGYGFAKGSHMQREQLGDVLFGYLQTAAQLRVAVLILDSRLGPTEMDRDMIHQLQVANIPFILVANKVDKLSRSQQMQSIGAIQAAYPGVVVVARSMVTGVGKGELMDEIHRTLKATS